MTERLRLGLVGGGRWARLHALAARHVTEVDLVGVWARNPGDAKALADELGVRAFATCDAMADEVEAMDLCVPPSAQVPLGIAAAGRGMHLMLEKPLAADLNGAIALREACREAGIVSQLMLTRRFHPYTQQFLSRVRDELGQVDGVNAHYVHGAFLNPALATPWRLAAGVLMDLGPHLVDLVEQVAGPTVSVSAFRTGAGAVAMTLTHRSGALSSAMLSGRAAGPGTHRLLAFGTNGKIEFDAACTDEEVALERAFTAFARASRGAEPTLADCARGVELQEVLQAASTSIAEGRRVGIDHV